MDDFIDHYEAPPQDRDSASDMILYRTTQVIPIYNFQFFPHRNREGTLGDDPARMIDSSDVRSIAVAGNEEFLGLKFLDHSWPAQLPWATAYYACKAISIAVFPYLRHNAFVRDAQNKKQFLKRDSGGWVPLDLLTGFMLKHRQSDMGPIEE